MTTAAFCAWAAERLLDELRRGEIPTGLTPLDIAWDPMSTVFRARIRPQDHELARQLVAERRTVMWGGVLTRAFLDDEELTRALLAAFDDETDVERQIGLFHHLTVRQLSSERQTEFESWVRANLEAFVADQRPTFGGEGGLARLVRRLESDDPGFRAKRWVYMYSALALPADTGREILTSNAEGNDPVVSSAARRALALVG